VGENGKKNADLQPLHHNDSEVVGDMTLTDFGRLLHVFSSLFHAVSRLLKLAV